MNNVQKQSSIRTDLMHCSFYLSQTSIKISKQSHFKIMVSVTKYCHWKASGLKIFKTYSQSAELLTNQQMLYRHDIRQEIEETRYYLKCFWNGWPGYTRIKQINYVFTSSSFLLQSNPPITPRNIKMYSDDDGQIILLVINLLHHDPPPYW